MPLRLSQFPAYYQPLLHTSRNLAYHQIPPTRTRVTYFHTTPSWKSDSEDYYSVLGLEPSAPPAAIKKQFYALSKAHHPDHHPNDPTASSRFVAISEAYATLGSPTKRSAYDRTHHPSPRSSSSHPTHNAPRGSHSSHTAHHTTGGPFGSRPASGLSKRRGAFRGPPPSFYKQGGWGSQGSKRKAGHDATSSAGAETASSGAGTSGFGFGANIHNSNPTNQSQSHNQNQTWHLNNDFNDVLHFDREGHFRTQDAQDKRRKLRAERKAEGASAWDDEGGSVVLRFCFVAGVVGLAALVPLWMGSERWERRDRRWEREKG
ncbi:hypothetical protein MMC09_005406 [Bachmanniomyces sp. S44760]|nr:hypothetical protein [Bachmanniomyces sp. S44760]